MRCEGNERERRDAERLRARGEQKRRRAGQCVSECGVALAPASHSSQHGDSVIFVLGHLGAPEDTPPEPYRPLPWVPSGLPWAPTLDTVAPALGLPLGQPLAPPDSSQDVPLATLGATLGSLLGYPMPSSRPCPLLPWSPRRRKIRTNKEETKVEEDNGENPCCE